MTENESIPRGQRGALPGLKPNTVLAGAYRVLRPIAEGGMAAVYEVEHLMTGAHRALKVMGWRFAGDEELERRFLQEARVGACIKSDHVAKVVDAGIDATLGMPFIVMELLEGVPLSMELRARGHFEPQEVLEILRQLCHAVGMAHADGVVHRDLKPSNVFLARSGTAGFSFMIKVLDFGIARVLADGHPDPLTLQLGTPAWMAPEQTEPGGQIGPETDVWALGLLAYALLTGRSYWTSSSQGGTSTAAVLREIVLEPLVSPEIRAREQNCESLIPEGFAGWFQHCVTRNPADRYADARIAYAALFAALPASSEQKPAHLTPTPGFGPDSSGLLAPTSVSAAAERTTQVEGWKRSTRRRTRDRRRGLVLGSAAASVLLLSATFAWLRPKIPQPSPGPVPSREASTPVPSSPPPGPVLLRLHGSNTIGAELAPALAEAFLKKRLGDAVVTRHSTATDEIRVEAYSKHNGVTEVVEIAAHGSSTAFQDLDQRKCDLGMASRRIHPEEISELRAHGDLSSAASEYTIGLDGIAVVVNPRNGVNELTRDQLTRVFAGEVNSWNQVGGKEGAIHLYVRDDRSGTYDLFRNLVLGKKPLAPAAQRIEDTEKLSDAVAGDPLGIGIVGLPYVRSTKPVMIREKDSVPLLPSSVSVATEDYLLSRRLYLYAPQEATATTRRFLDFALSDEGQHIVEDTGFVDLLPECDSRASRCKTCSSTYRYVIRNACRLSVTFRFDEEGRQLDTRALRDLGRMANALSEAPLATKNIVLVGFWDAATEASRAVELSQLRAEQVAQQLRARGLNVTTVVGLGADNLVADTTTVDGRRRNRRVEAWLR